MRGRERTTSRLPPRRVRDFDSSMSRILRSRAGRERHEDRALIICRGTTVWALTALLCGASLAAQRVSSVRLYALQCEHLDNPIGIGKPAPRLSWKLRSERSGEAQTAY